MKKLLFGLLVVIFALSGFGTVVSADEGSVSSVTVKSSIEIIGGELNEETGCYELETEDGNIISAVPYYLKDVLEDDEKEEFEKAYKSIEGADISKLVDNIEKKAHKAGAEVEDLVVSDVFYISEKGANHKDIKLSITTDSLKNFVCLVHYVDGEWVVVEDCEYVQNGKNYFTFTLEEAGAYAIVVASELNYSINIWFYVSLIVLAVTLFITVFVKKEKKGVRNTAAVISIVLSAVSVILSNYEYTLYVAIADAVVVAIMAVITFSKGKEE